MVRILAGTAFVAIGMLVGAPAMAADGWALQIIEDANKAEKQVARANVRVASLGDTNVEASSRPARAKRASSIEQVDRPQTRRTRVASLGNVKADTAEREQRPRRSQSGGSVNWIADSGCLNGTLRGIIGSLASNYGPVTVNSTCRSRSRNASVGGAPKSYHLQGEAVDFRMNGNVSAAYASLRNNGNVGGLKHYGGGLFHIDTGPRRSW